MKKTIKRTKKRFLTVPPKPINNRTIKQAIFDIIIELHGREPEPQISKYITSQCPAEIDFWQSMMTGTYGYTIETVEIEYDEDE